jgi:hypothetical protein
VLSRAQAVQLERDSCRALAAAAASARMDGDKQPAGAAPPAARDASPELPVRAYATRIAQAVTDNVVTVRLATAPRAPLACHLLLASP